MANTFELLVFHHKVVNSLGISIRAFQANGASFRIVIKDIPSIKNNKTSYFLMVNNKVLVVFSNDASINEPS